MTLRMDYARPVGRRARSGFRAGVPRAALVVLSALFVLGWFGFFAVGGVAAVDSHFERSPENDPAFRLTPWRPANPASPGGALTRDAIRPLTFHTLRYQQVTHDGGVTVEPAGYHADVRWGPTSAALVVTGVLPFLAFGALRRLLR